MNSVLDASAILALLLGETGAEEVEAKLDASCVSAVNVAEVIAKLMEKGFRKERALGLWSGLAVEVIDFNADQAIGSGLLRLSTQAAGLSLGDRACLNLAALRAATAVTADRAWSRVNIGVPVELVR
ncbi:MAG: type II toxin-antitoxin system VapC family toxin [Caulobacter sp.]|nr:type II toxin-antitoxin system VapC family toxin [Caulobacter sp.]